MEPRPPHRHPLTLMPLQHHVPGADTVTVRKDLRPLPGYPALDIYEPVQHHDHARPWVLFVNGLSDIGARRILGCAIKDMASFDSWGRAIAASGIVGIAHSTGSDPASDVRSVWAMLQARATDFRLAPERGALWACSSHVPNALGLLLDSASAPRAAAFCYGYMLDLDGEHGVAEAQRTWRFANPVAGRHLGELTPVPTLVVRAGRDDTPHVNLTIDAFARHALAANFPLTLVNYPAGVHAFDLVDVTAPASVAVAQVLDFLTRQLRTEGETPAATGPSRSSPGWA